MHGTGQYSISDLAEFFSVSRPTVHRTLNRRKIPWSVILHSAGADPLWDFSYLCWVRAKMRQELSGIRERLARIQVRRSTTQLSA